MNSGTPLTSFLDSLELRSIRPAARAVRGNPNSLEELTKSIGQEGLLQPIVVRPVENGFEVVAGNRRLEACRRLGWGKVPCHIVELDDKAAFEVALVENIQRETMNPLEEAEAFKRYVDDYGYGGVSELASRIGKSHTYVSRRIGLLDLPESVREEVVRRRTTPSVAEELNSLDDESATEILEMIQEKHLSMREVRRMVGRRRRNTIDPPVPSSPFQTFEDTGPRKTDRTLGKAIASLKTNVYRLNDIIDDTEGGGDWVLREMLLRCRDTLNTEIENLLRFRKKIRRCTR